ncbi:helix-turn-helix domain-containing protein [Flavihumibacter rivuli]|uniref:helix-turn-helix domain-containing protein n=1 Tax=Flavihumibacter rivuli TaxID=2838156 RepID=UPI001BDF1F17|nr:helix-turn-helix domain-containing protein [Flavihumibacter rivuli]ULQ54915.1 helix-turn-helix domain-containing protein [Flavihumibacter rivuli]
MIFKDFLPHPALREEVAVYHLRHFIMHGGKQLPFKPYPPRPEQCLAFYPRGQETTMLVPDGKLIRQPGVMLMGQFTHRINRHISEEFLMILVVFKPGALHRLTGIPFTELLNQTVDACVVIGNEACAVNERLSNTGDYREMIAIIDDFLLSLVRRKRHSSHPSDQVFDLMLTSNERFSIDWLASQSCYSIRQFERKFQAAIGVSPRTFERIIRFNRSYQMRLQRPHWDWLRIAMECGYHDYQHLAKDYREFANGSPNDFFREESKAPERVLGLNG